MVRHLARLVAGRAPEREGEIALTRSLAAGLGLLDGDQLRPAATVPFRGRPWAVTALALDPSCVSCARAVIAQRELPARTASRKSYLVDLPDGTDSAALQADLKRTGGSIELRGDLPPDEEIRGMWLPISNRDVLIKLVAGMAVLQVVLLAGTAFAVGARRQARELGMLAAQGARPRVLAGSLLGQGLILGALGAATGVGLGVGVMAATLRRWQPPNALPGPLRADAGDLAVIAGLGLLAALAASGAAAVAAARRSPVDALSARPSREVSQTRTVLGVLALLGGAALAYVGHRGLQAALDPQLRTSRRYDDVLVGPFMSDYTTFRDGPFASVLAGTSVAVAGLVLLAPALLGAVAALGRRVPVSPRLALRDVARHRHRTATATSAIAVATAGAVAVSIFVAGELRTTVLRNEVRLPEGTALVTAQDRQREAVPAREAAAVRVVEAALPDVRRVPLGRVDLEPLLWALAEPGSHGYAPGYPDFCEQRPAPCDPLIDPPGIGDPALLDLVAASPAARADMASALAAGKVVVFDPSRLNADGKVTIFTKLTGNQKPEFVQLPGVVGERAGRFHSLPDAYVSEDAARAQGWGVRHEGTLLRYGGTPLRHGMLDSEWTAINQAVRRAGGDVTPGGPDTSTIITDRPVLRRTVLLAALAVALLGVAIPVALAGIEGRADAATMAAVGATPRRRRRFAGAHALVVAGVGTAMGLALGFGIALAARPATGATGIVVPWDDIGLLVGAVLGLALAAGLAGTLRRPMLIRRES